MAPCPCCYPPITGLSVVASGSFLYADAVNVVYLFSDPPWLKSLGDLITSGIGLAVAIRIWQVFPFSFQGSAAWWSTAVRVLLILVVAGSAISIVVQAVSLARRATHHTPHGGRLSTRT